MNIVIYKTAIFRPAFNSIVHSHSENTMRQRYIYIYIQYIPIVYFIYNYLTKERREFLSEALKKHVIRPARATQYSGGFKYVNNWINLLQVIEM